MLKNLIVSFKRYFWIKKIWLPYVPQKNEMVATFEVPLELMDVANYRMSWVKPGKYPLFRVDNPYFEHGQWLVIKGMMVGAVESFWGDCVRSGQVTFEENGVG